MNVDNDKANESDFLNVYNRLNLSPVTISTSSKNTSRICHNNIPRSSNNSSSSSNNSSSNSSRNPGCQMCHRIRCKLLSTLNSHRPISTNLLNRKKREMSIILIRRPVVLLAIPVRITRMQPISSNITAVIAGSNNSSSSNSSNSSSNRRLLVTEKRINRRWTIGISRIACP